MRSLLSLLVAVVFALPTLASPEVWFVSRGPEFGHFETIQAAVDAANDGDMIIVRRGHYAPFAIDGKGLSVVAEFPESVWVEAQAGSAIRVENVPAASRALLADLGVMQTSSDVVGTVLLHDNLGGVQLERVIVGSTKIHPVQQSLRIVSCDDVTIIASGFAQGVLARLSTVRLHETRIHGAQGAGCVSSPPSKPGGPGLEVLSGDVLLADCVVQGGRGGDGSNPLNCCNGPGGPGLLLGTDNPTVTVRGGELKGGTPGADMGCAPFGPPSQTLSGQLVFATGATPVGGFATEWAHSGDASAIVARAAAGQAVFAGFSLATASTPVPLVQGELLLASPLLAVVPFGASDGFEAGLDSPVPFLPPGTPPLELFAQTLASDPVDGALLGPRDRILLVDMASAIAGDADCDGDGVTDSFAIWSGLARDDDRNGVPDSCEAHPVIHIDDDAPGDPAPGSTSAADPLADGSAAHPFDNLADAVAAAGPGFTVIDIAPGTYTGLDNRDVEVRGLELLVRGAGDPATLFDLQQFGRLLRVEGESRVTLADFAVVNGRKLNDAGGAVNATFATLVARNMRFEGNHAIHGGAVSSYGSEVDLRDVQFINNSAIESGGAYFENAPILASLSTTGARVERVTFAGNSCGEEGGAFTSANKTVGPRVVSSRFVDNHAELSGGAVYMLSSTAVFESCHIADNEAALWGGAFYTQRTTTPFYLKPLTLRQCTLRGNEAFISGAVLHGYGARILGSVLWDNTINATTLPIEISPFGNHANFGIFEGAYEAPEFVIRDTTLEHGLAGIFGTGFIEIIAGPGIDSLDPQFASTDPTTPTLTPGSPAIDHGGSTWAPPLGALDVEGGPRRVGARVDRGADEAP